MKTLFSLMIVAVLAACSPSTSHCPHCATKAGHQDCCGDKSGFCPHGQRGEHKHPHGGKHHHDAKHAPRPVPGKMPCHGAAVKDYDVKHDAEWHNSHAAH